MPFEQAKTVFVTERNVNAVKEILQFESKGEIDQAWDLFTKTANELASAYAWVTCGYILTRCNYFEQAGIAFLLAAAVGINKGVSYKASYHIRQNFHSAACAFYSAGDHERGDGCIEKMRDYQI